MDVRNIQMYEEVYLSPHLDDVAFSCPASLIQSTNANKKVLVATIFSEGGKKRAKKFQIRQQEEQAAANKFSYDYILAGFPDFRETKIVSHEGLIWSELTEIDLIQNVHNWIENLLTRTKPKRIFAPLGAGRHIDHRIVHSACTQISQKIDTEFWFYEDRPYAFSPEVVNIALTELGYDVSVDFDYFLQHLFDTGFHRRLKYTDHTLSKRKGQYLSYVEKIKTVVLKKQPVTSRMITADFENIRNLVKCYQSQLNPFIGSQQDFIQDVKMVANYIKQEEEYYEKYWKLF